MGSNLPRRSLQCVTKEHPGQYSLCGPVLSDQTAITRMEAVMATGSGRTRAGAGLTIPTLGNNSAVCPPVCHGGLVPLSYIQFANHPMFPLGKVSLCLSLPRRKQQWPQPALYKDATDVLWLTTQSGKLWPKTSVQWSERSREKERGQSLGLAAFPTWGGHMSTQA